MKFKCEKEEHCHSTKLNNFVQRNIDQQAPFFQPSKASENRVQKQGRRHHEPEPEECACTGSRRRKEIHIKLGGTKGVKIFYRNGDLQEFSDVVTGPSTNTKVRCEKYTVQGKQLVSGHGLMYFVNYDGNFGFHSNYEIDRNDSNRDGSTTDIIRIPGAQSAGCVRLHDTRPPVPPGSSRAATANEGLDSKRFYNHVALGDLVWVYDDSHWRTPNYRPHCRMRRTSH